MIQTAVYSDYLVLNYSYFYRLSHEVFVKLSKPHSLEFGEDIEIFYVVQDFCLVTVCCAQTFYVVLKHFTLRSNIFMSFHFWNAGLPCLSN